MKGKKYKWVTVFVGVHSVMFKDCLSRWLDNHPRTIRYCSDKELGNEEYVTMSENAWRKFCLDTYFDFNALGVWWGKI